MSGERGQTGAEMMGVLLLVGGIVAAVSATGTPGHVASRTRQLVCKIGGEGCAATAPPRTSLPRRGGPPLGHGITFRALPYPGSVTVTCTADKKSDRTTCLPKGKSGVTVQVAGEIKVERTPTQLDANGCPWQKLSITSKLQLVGQGEYKGAKAGGALQGYLGTQSKYELTVTPDDADAIAGGDRQAPNPVDPTSLATGESIQLNEDYYAGLGLKANYRNLQLELGYDQGTRVSSGVKRLDANTVRIYVGDEDFVREALKAGVKLGSLVQLGLGSSKDLANGKLTSVDVDISTTAGWNAYQQFVATGHLPAAGAGVSQPSNATTLKYTDTLELQAKLGAVRLGEQLGSSEGRVTETTNPDGSTERAVFVRYNDTGLAVDTKTDVNGHATTTRSLLLHDVDPSLVEELYHLNGSTPPADPGHDARLDFSEAQLSQLQQYALDDLADKVEQSQGKRPTNAEIQQSLRDNHGVIKFDGVEYDFGGLESLLGEAQSPNDMLIALYHGGASAAGALDNLMKLVLLHGGKLPGTIVTPSC